MKNLLSSIKNNTTSSILFVLILGYILLKTSSYLSYITIPFIEKHLSLSFYTSNMVMKSFLLILSIVMILFINNASLKDYGFTRARNVKYYKIIWVTIGVSVLSFIVGNLLFNGLLRHYFPTENPKGFPKPSSIIEMIISVWIWSSICEEILVRGFVQSFLIHLKKYHFFKLSLPIVISGLFFGAMHLSLLKIDFDIWFVSFIVFYTTVIGLLAAHYREKSNSLIPPILIHFLANFVGSTPLLIITLLDIQLPVT